MNPLPGPDGHPQIHAAVRAGQKGHTVTVRHHGIVVVGIEEFPGQCLLDLQDIQDRSVDHLAMGFAPRRQAHHRELPDALQVLGGESSLDFFMFHVYSRPARGLQVFPWRGRESTFRLQGDAVLTVQAHHNSGRASQ